MQLVAVFEDVTKLRMSAGSQSLLHLRACLFWELTQSGRDPLLNGRWCAEGSVDGMVADDYALRVDIIVSAREVSDAVLHLGVDVSASLHV